MYLLTQCLLIVVVDFAWNDVCNKAVVCQTFMCFRNLTLAMLDYRCHIHVIVSSSFIVNRTRSSSSSSSSSNSSIFLMFVLSGELCV